jgi:2-dehydropantoate 2-reductase
VSTIAVLGPGGVGGFVAAALSRAGEEVVVIARPETAEAVDRNGIRVQSVRLGEFTARPRAAHELTTPVDLLIVATKATTLDDALTRIKRDPELVLPLLNGLDHMTILRDRFGTGRVAAGTIRIDALRRAPGEIVQTSPFLRIDLAADEPAPHGALERTCATLTRAGIPAEIGRSEAQVLWSKLVRLNALACTTSVTGKAVGFIRSDPDWRAALEACMLEAAAVAGAEGADVDPRARMQELDEAHPELESSMQQDIAAGREPELEAIPGAVLRAAARHGLQCPTIERLYTEIAAHLHE